jgi:hypothetical protein
MSKTSIFSPEALSKVVSDTLPADARPGEKIVVGTVDQNGAQVVASFKNNVQGSGLNWELQAAARHDWNGDNSVGAKVLLRW